MKIRTQFQPKHLQAFVDINKKCLELGIAPGEVRELENNREGFGIRPFQILEVTDGAYQAIKDHFADQGLNDRVEVIE